MVLSAVDNVVALPSRSEALIPDGNYQVAFERYGLSTRFNRGSLELWFKILDYGEHFGRLVPRYYRVDLGDGKKAARTFRASRHSAFAREFVAVFRKAPPAGVAALHWFRDIAIDAAIRTVSSDHRQRQLDQPLRYNVVAELIRRARP